MLACCCSFVRPFRLLCIALWMAKQIFHLQMMIFFLLSLAHRIVSHMLPATIAFPSKSRCRSVCRGHTFIGKLNICEHLSASIVWMENCRFKVQEGSSYLLDSCRSPFEDNEIPATLKRATSEKVLFRSTSFQSFSSASGSRPKD